MKRFSRNTIIVVGMAIIVVLAVEVLFRLMYSIRYKNTAYMAFGIDNVFSYDVADFKGYIKLEEGVYRPFSHGFRTEPFDVKKPRNEYRIVALGGSSTYGVIGAYYDSWPYVLQQQLNATLDDSTYRVINAGIPRQTTYGVHRLLHEEILSMEPDAVVIYSLNNHVFFDTPEVEQSGRMADYLFRLSKSLLYGKSLVATCLIEKIGTRVNRGLQNKFDTYRYLLSDMVQTCHEYGIKVIVVKQLIDPEYFPKSNYDSRTRISGNSSPSQYYDFLTIIDRVCDELSCVVVDFSPASPAIQENVSDFKSLLGGSDIVHLIRKGKELLTDAIYKKFIEMNDQQV